MLFFFKKLSFLETFALLLKILGNKILSFLRFFLFDGSIGGATKFHADDILILEKNELLKVFPAPGNFGAPWCTTWQLCCRNNSNDRGYMNYTCFSKFIIVS